MSATRSHASELPRNDPLRGRGRDRDCLESRVRAEFRQHSLHMISHGRRTDVPHGRDLCGGSSACQFDEKVTLSIGQLRIAMRVGPDRQQRTVLIGKVCGAARDRAQRRDEVAGSSVLGHDRTAGRTSGTQGALFR
jgi:hypothetical protein